MKNLLKTYAVAFIVIAISANTAFSQGNTWKLNLNSNVGPDDGIGSSNFADFNFFTNNLKQFSILKDGNIEAENDMWVKGKLRIGPKSITIGGSLFAPGDEIVSDIGEIYFGNNSPFIFSNILIGIGLNTPQHKLHLHDNQIIGTWPPSVLPDEVRIAFTNEAQLGGTGALSTDGFLIGIDPIGTAEINQQEDMPMLFYTGAGVGNEERMRITHGEGFIGVNTDNPQSRLHIFDNNAVYTQFTNNAVVNGFQVGIVANGLAQIRQRENSAIDIHTNDIRRMRIWHSANNNARIGIGPMVFTPLTYLHLGTNAAGGGFRDWMNIGTLYNRGTDNMYIGLLEINGDNNDAIINWGNNPLGQPQADRLRFIFTTPEDGWTMNAEDEFGLEIARMVSDGDQGFTGIGGFPPVDLQPIGNPYFNGGFDPTNTLEVNSPATTDIPGNSGLRFTDLTSASEPEDNLSGNVLSVNEDGDVILVLDLGEGMGADDDWDFTTFTNDMVSIPIGNVGVGTGLVNPPNAKLDVFQDIAGGGIALNVLNMGEANCLDMLNNSDINYGIISRVEGNSVGNGCEPIHIAGLFSAQNAIDNFAIIVPPGCGNVGLGTENPSKLLSVGEAVDPTTAAIAHKWLIFSDVNLKNNINTINNPIDIIKRIRGVTFNWISNGSEDIGFISQELDTVLPVIVHTDSFTGYKSSDYGRIVPVLVEAMKEQQKIIDSLKTDIADLQATVYLCCSNNKSLPAGDNGSSEINPNINIVPDNSVLYQNAPNPFSEQTEIKYYLSENVTQAEMFIFDMQGKQIKRYELTTFNGNGKIIINGGELTPGMFFYSLIANGKEVGTKRMIITE